MSILIDTQLLKMLNKLIPHGADPELINPASIDICIGNSLREEVGGDRWKDIDLRGYSKEWPYRLRPGAFVLVSTLEHVHVSNGYAVDLRLKSSRAREGYEHALAFWVDPGWDGVLTMEIKNWSEYQSLPLYPGLRFGQMIVHKLAGRAAKPYSGKYNKATTVEGAKI